MKKNNKDQTVKFTTSTDKKQFGAMTQKLFGNLFNSKLFLTQTNSQSNHIPKRKHFENKELSSEDLDSFITRLNNKEKMLEDMFKNKVVNKSNLTDCFINLAYYKDVERKRFSYGIEVYQKHNDMIACKDPIFRQHLIGHGESTTNFKKLLNEIEKKVKALKRAEKNISINVSTPERTLAALFFNEFENNPLYKSVSTLKFRTDFHEKHKRITSKLIEKDVELHLKNLKEPETVAIWTDGSVNKNDNCSGTGILIRHQGKEERFSINNENEPDNTYAEFKGVYEALKMVVKNENYKDKKIIIVSDNDTMAYSIRQMLNGEKCAPQPFLKEICDVFKHFDIDVHFHNVKSHIHENILEEDKDKYYDFYYNNIVDDLAREGAGLKTKEQAKKDLKARKKARKKQKV